MKNSASRLLKQIIAGISSMAKSKTMALKSKTSAIKARLIIFSLMKNKKFLMSSLSEKIHSVLGHHSYHQSNEDCMLEDGSDHHNKAMVVYNNNAHTYEALPNPSSETQVVEEQDHDGYDGYYGVDGDDDKYPDLTHTLFDSEDLDLGGSVIDLVKNSKEEAGQEFKLEDEIDQCADLFYQKVQEADDIAEARLIEEAAGNSGEGCLNFIPILAHIWFMVEKLQTYLWGKVCSSGANVLLDPKISL